MGESATDLLNESLYFDGVFGACWCEVAVVVFGTINVMVVVFSIAQRLFKFEIVCDVLVPQRKALRLTDPVLRDTKPRIALLGAMASDL